MPPSPTPTIKRSALNSLGFKRIIQDISHARCMGPIRWVQWSCGTFRNLNVGLYLVLGPTLPFLSPLFFGAATASPLLLGYMFFSFNHSSSPPALFLLFHILSFFQLVLLQQWFIYLLGGGGRERPAAAHREFTDSCWKTMAFQKCYLKYSQRLEDYCHLWAEQTKPKDADGRQSHRAVL